MRDSGDVGPHNAQGLPAPVPEAGGFVISLIFEPELFGNTASGLTLSSLLFPLGDTDGAQMRGALVDETHDHDGSLISSDGGCRSGAIPRCLNLLVSISQHLSHISVFSSLYS